jgi:hypothetical protein
MAWKAAPVARSFRGVSAGLAFIVPALRCLPAEEERPGHRQPGIIAFAAGAAAYGYFQGKKPWKIETMKMRKPHITGTAKVALHFRALLSQSELKIG